MIKIRLFIVAVLLILISILNTSNVEAPQGSIIVENPIVLSPPELSYYTDIYTITAYCPCEICCGEWAKSRPLDEKGEPIVVGANGKRLVKDYHVASPLPFGTIIEIADRQYEVQDRTAIWISDRYNTKIIDLYVSSHQKAIQIGRRKVEVKIYE